MQVFARMRDHAVSLSLSLSFCVHDRFRIHALTHRHDYFLVWSPLPLSLSLPLLFLSVSLALSVFLSLSLCPSPSPSSHHPFPPTRNTLPPPSLPPSLSLSLSPSLPRTCAQLHAHVRALATHMNANEYARALINTGANARERGHGPIKRGLVVAIWLRVGARSLSSLAGGYALAQQPVRAILRARSLSSLAGVYTLAQQLGQACQGQGSSNA